MSETTTAVPALPELSAEELSAYSLTRALAVAAYDLQGPSLEREVADAFSAAMRGVPTRGVPVPLAALNTGTATAGGNAVFEGAGPLIEELRPRSVLASLGATLITDLQLPFGMPRVDSTEEAIFVPETPGAPHDDDDAKFGKVQFEPHTAYTALPMTRKWLTTSSLQLDRELRALMARRVMASWDRVSLTGDGVLEPLGLLDMAGLAIVEIGTNGGVPTWGHVLALEESASDADADPLGPAGYLTTSGLRRVLKQTEKAPGSGMIWSGNFMNGAPAVASTRVPNDLTKGTGADLHALLFGIWSELVIALSPVLDVVVDPVSRLKQGLLEVSVYSIGDVQVRHLDAFAAIKDAALS